jgi:hypothetical protein
MEEERAWVEDGMGLVEVSVPSTDSPDSMETRRGTESDFMEEREWAEIEPRGLEED